jgi:hypothetical protein
MPEPLRSTRTPATVWQPPSGYPWHWRAAEQQAQVAREVDSNLVAIRDLSAQSAAGAVQTNAASHELSRLAVELNDLVSRFCT